MKQMGINPNNLPKNMPGGMDMSALEGMMGQGGNYGCNSAWHKNWGSHSAPSLKGY